jgi:muramoyltetrapeptide carboxypeptidase
MKPLPPGGTIGVAAPASPDDARSEVLRGVECWEAQGYRVKLADGLFSRDDYVAGDPRERAADLNALFADPRSTSSRPSRAATALHRRFRTSTST